MTDLCRRTSPADLEVRGSDGRTVVGLAVPFDEPTDVGGFTEVIRHGAFARTIAERGPERVKFLALHDTRAMPLGRATELREDAGGLWGSFRVSKTTAGDEALELIRDGALDGLSIGFKPIRDGPVVDGLVERLEVALYEVSAVAFPAYAGALVEAVRQESTRDPAEMGVGAIWTPGTSPADLAERFAALTPKIHTRDARQRLAALTKGTFR